MQVGGWITNGMKNDLKQQSSVSSVRLCSLPQMRRYATKALTVQSVTDPCLNRPKAGLMLHLIMWERQQQTCWEFLDGGRV